MATFHPSLTNEKWQRLSPAHQILNIAAELSRARNATAQGDSISCTHSLERVSELLELSIADQKWLRNSRREFLRLKEFLAGYYISDNKKSEHLTQALQVLLFFHKDSSIVKI